MPCHPRSLFLSVVEPELLCCVCGGVMIDPRQLACGHDCGCGCIAIDGSCSLCDVKGAASEIRIAAKLIARLPVKCALCGWEGPCGDHGNHQCPLEAVVCPFKCGEAPLRGKLSLHVSECPLRMEMCPYCFQKFRAQDFPFHESKCTLKPVECPGCLEFFKRKEISEHLASTCPKCEVECPFVEFGCAARMLRCDVESHLSASLAHHCEVLVVHVRQEKDEHRQTMALHKNKIDELEAKLQGTFTVAGVPVADSITSLEARLFVQETDVAALLEGRLLTVDPSGHCGNFRTVTDALARFRPGDCIVLRPGVYSETVEVTENHSGLVMRGSGSDSTFISGKVIVHTCGTFEDFSVINRLDRDSPALRVVAQSPQFVRIHLTSINLSCVVVDGGSPTFDECLVSGSKQHCVLWRGEAGRLSKCTLSDCRDSAVNVERGVLTVASCDVFGSDGSGVTIHHGARCIAEDTAIHDNGCSNVDEAVVSSRSFAALCSALQNVGCLCVESAGWKHQNFSKTSCPIFLWLPKVVPQYSTPKSCVDFNMEL